MPSQVPSSNPAAWFVISTKLYQCEDVSHSLFVLQGIIYNLYVNSSLLTQFSVQQTALRAACTLSCHQGVLAKKMISMMSASRCESSQPRKTLGKSLNQVAATVGTGGAVNVPPKTPSITTFSVLIGLSGCYTVSLKETPPTNRQERGRFWQQTDMRTMVKLLKLDGVGPVNNRPSNN